MRRAYEVDVVVKHRDNRRKGEVLHTKSLWRLEVAFAALGRWSRLARSFEGTEASKTKWLQIAR